MADWHHPLLAWALLSAFGLSGQTAGLSVTADRDSIGLGEPLTLTLQSDEPLVEGKRYAWPNWNQGDTLAQGWEVIGWGQVDSVRSPVVESALRRTQTVEVLAWDTGFRVIAPLVLPGTAGDTLISEPILIEVGLTPLEDTPAPKPLQGYRAYSWSWWERLLHSLPYLLAGLAILAFAWWWSKRKAKPTPEATPVPTQPDVPAHLAALRILERLLQEQPWLQGEGKSTQSELSEAIRIHLQGTLGIKALERTSDELQAQLRSGTAPGIAPEDARWLVATLLQSDLVKFAKQELSADAHMNSIRSAMTWIQRTAPQDPEDAPSESDATETENDV